jgi:tetratricopeptide (TPR) repeat protein
LSLPCRVLSCRFWLALACCGSLVSLSSAATSIAAAPSRPGEGARLHHEAGRAHVAQGRYESAVGEYRKAYELRADPSYLLDIAEAYRALQVSAQAVFFYRRYLSAHPAPPNRPEIEAQIALLEPAAPRSFPAPSPAPARRVRPELGLEATRGVSEDERGVVGRWWFWAAVGALAATGATVAILAAGRRDEQAPSTMLGNVKLF